MIALLVFLALAILGLAYRFYGSWLSRHLQLDAGRATPAHTQADGMDFVPAKTSLLLGQHFSAIAAAGPIVGPILAGIWFGWLPALLWILLGSIFIGGVHDMASLTGSLRHRGASIGALVQNYISPKAKVIFLIFVWLALVYVILAFTDITAQTFRAAAIGPVVAASSLVYLVLGLGMGLMIRFLKVKLWLATVIFLPLVLLTIGFGPYLPAEWLGGLAKLSARQWGIMLLGYCFLASLLPVWLLLQPRGYLGGWFLYMTIGVALLGALWAGLPIRYPALHLQGLSSLTNGKWLFPALFITVACGACSGFHGIVSSGTTAKQLDKETDARPVGYGAMLLEAVVGVLALVTLMILSPGDALLKGDPNMIYAHGLAGYLKKAGVTFEWALAFALLAFSTFVYDTLDVCTRLARYIVQELTGWQGLGGAIWATISTLAVPALVLLTTAEKGYLVAWPIFGASNQLLASLTLLAIAAWLGKKKKSVCFALLPMGFMLLITFFALGQQLWDFLQRWRQGAPDVWQPERALSFLAALCLLALGSWVFWEARALFRPARNPVDPAA